MIRLNICEAKTHLCRHLRDLKRGETILLCKRNRPIAEIRPLPEETPAQRRIGMYKGQIEIPDSFFDPLPSSIRLAFNGDKE